MNIQGTLLEEPTVERTRKRIKTSYQKDQPIADWECILKTLSLLQPMGIELLISVQIHEHI